MINLPSSLVAVKNSLDSDEPAVVLVQIDMPDLNEPIRIAANEVDLTWSGETWVAFPFEVDNVGEPARGETQQVVLRVSNITRAVQGYVDQAAGGVDADVTLHVINAGDLAETETYITLLFRVAGTICDENWVTFNLTSADMWRRTFPKNNCHKNHCSYRFKDIFCAYSGVETTCDHTLSRCRELANENRFGGFPSIGFRGIKE